MRVLVVDLLAGSQLRQALYRSLAASKEVEITLLVPKRWHDGYVECPALEEATGEFSVKTGATLFSGRMHRALIPRLWSILRQEHTDLLLVNAEPEDFLSIHALLGARAFSPATPVVLTSWRNIDFPRGVYPYRLPALHAMIERWVLGRITGMITHNEPALEIFRTKGVREIACIPPSVDTDAFSQCDRLESRRLLGIRRFAVGYAGRLVKEKGVELLLEACSGLVFDHELLILGAGPEERVLRARAEQLGISSRVRWEGPIAQERLPLYLSALDVLVLPSRTTPRWKEQFGRILIEAMSCGTPVMGSNSGEIPRVIDAAGLIFPEGDVHALRSGLEDLKGHPRLAEDFSRLGRNRALAVYSTGALAPPTLSFLRSVSSLNSLH
jgi:glycosyltransferase involved in cell wall biosynthesis